jgi:hypothetical protein
MPTVCDTERLSGSRAALYRLFKQRLIEIQNLEGTLTREQCNDLSNGIGIASQQQFAIFNSTIIDLRFAPLEHNHAILEGAMAERLAVQLDFLTRKGGVFILNLKAFHDITVFRESSQIIVSTLGMYQQPAAKSRQNNS